VTKTDLKGQITYANRAFIEISGFSEQELLGQPHNVVRHPDMPAEAFDDLWQTIKAGHPWRGLVKNRSKQGDYYWVDAYVTPSARTATPLATCRYAVHRTSSNASRPNSCTPISAPNAAASRHTSATGNEHAKAAHPLHAAAHHCPAGRVHPAGEHYSRHSQCRQHHLADWCGSADSPMPGSATGHAKQGLAKLAEGNFKDAIPQLGCQDMRHMLEMLETTRINTRAVLADVVTGAHDVSLAATATHTEASNLQNAANMRWKASPA
jgi:aerotaxis receptor